MSSGRDIVVYTSACSDSVPLLEIFRSNCMPIFLFLAEGELVAFVHGADGRKMREVTYWRSLLTPCNEAPCSQSRSFQPDLITCIF